jgi:hypothetical protein
MAGEARLTLAEDLTEIIDAKRAARAERQQAQAGRVRGCGQGGEKAIHLT